MYIYTYECKYIQMYMLKAKRCKIGDFANVQERLDIFQNVQGVNRYFAKCLDNFGYFEECLVLSWKFCKMLNFALCL